MNQWVEEGSKGRQAFLECEGSIRKLSGVWDEERK